MKVVLCFWPVVNSSYFYESHVWSYYEICAACRTSRWKRSFESIAVLTKQITVQSSSALMVKWLIRRQHQMIWIWNQIFALTYCRRAPSVCLSIAFDRQMCISYLVWLFHSNIHYCRDFLSGCWCNSVLVIIQWFSAAKSNLSLSTLDFIVLGFSRAFI